MFGGGSALSTNRRPGPPVEGFDTGALLSARDYIKTTTRSFSAVQIRRVLRAMDERRRQRGPAAPNPRELPEMSPAEMQREITWRLGTLPLEDAQAIAKFVRQLALRVP